MSELQKKVQVWIYHAAAREVLLLQTNEKRGEFWQPVTGSVDPGESFEVAALREAQEESGLSFLESPFRLGYEFGYLGRKGPAWETIFALQAQNREVTIDPKEHQAWEWCSFEDALKKTRFEDNRNGLRFLMWWLE